MTGDGRDRLYDLYEMYFGRAPDSAGEESTWIEVEWKAFIKSNGHPRRYRYYCEGHRLEEEFFAKIESRIFLRELLET